MFQQWLYGKAASGLERKLCKVLVKRTQESMDRCTGQLNITEMLLKTALNTIQSIIKTLHYEYSLFLCVVHFKSHPYHKMRTFQTIGKKPLENIVVKGVNACDHHFLLFPQCFLPFKALPHNFDI